MRLSDLEESGGLIPLEPFAREIKWVAPDGSEVVMTALVRQLPFADFERYGDSGMSPVDKSYHFVGDAIILENDDGTHAPLGYDVARRLNMNLMLALLSAAQEVNNIDAGKR
jgi:hypothetical protein